MALTNYHAEQALTKRALSHHILLKLGFALSSGMTMNLGLFNLYMPPVLADSLSWVQIGGPAASLIGGGYKQYVYATNPTTGDIYHYNGTPSNWTRIGSPGRVCSYIFW